MSNKLLCPSCGKSHDMSEMLRTMNAECAFRVAMSVPAEISDLVLNYTELFAPTKQSLSLHRRGKLIQTLDLPNRDPKAVAYAIEQVLERDSMGKLTKPLSNHNYLLKVMESYVPEESADTLQNSGLVLSNRQIQYFGAQLSINQEFQTAYARIGESQGEFMLRIEGDLSKSEKVCEYMPYLEAVGFEMDINRK